MSVYPRADGIYVYDFQFRRRRFFGTTGVKSKRAAENFEGAVRKQARAAFAKQAERRAAALTLESAFERFWTEVGEHYTGSYRQTVWGALRWLDKAIGAQTLIRDIGPDKISHAIARRRGEGVSNATVNRTVTELMRTILRRAERNWEQEVRRIEWHRLILKEPRERVRELRDHEEPKLTQSMRDDYRPAVQYVKISGLRKKELVGLRWSDIDWSARTVTVHGKGGKIALIPLTDAQAAILAPLRGDHPEFVFTYRAVATRRKNGVPWRIKGRRYPITYSGLSSAWRRFGGAKAGLDDFRFHDLRHTAATRLLRATGNLRLVQKLLRHEDIATTARYAHVTDDDLRAGMEAAEKTGPTVVGHGGKLAQTEQTQAENVTESPAKSPANGGDIGIKRLIL